MERTADLTGFSTKVNPKFRPLFKDLHRKQILVGGASSSKSYSTGQKIIYKMGRHPGRKFLVVRKVARTLRHSVFDLLLAIIKDANLSDLFKINQSELTITHTGTENELLFTGLDDVEKLKSIHGITDIWIEEASEISQADFNQLDLRVRGETKYKKQITMTMNPISAQHWIKKRFFDRKEDDTITHRSTYKDNKFLDADTIKNLESITDPYFKMVYVDGEWGIYGNVVFHNFIVEEFDYTEDDLESVFTGLDFGFVHAQAMERAGYKDGELYVFDELYERGVINSEFMQHAKEQFGEDVLRSMYITADSANPDKIKEWEDAGYRIEGAKKGPGSVRFGVEYLTGLRIHVHATKCTNLAKELQSFKRREDKDGNVTEDFVEINDDGIAALRYGSEYIWDNRRIYYEETDYSADDLGL